MAKVLYERRGSTVLITINRPEAMNAYDAEAVTEMGRCFEDFDRDEDLRVAILTGAGDKAFCVGADL
jgi:enoyl-CoA hydratase/carnithine racemase